MLSARWDLEEHYALLQSLPVSARLDVLRPAEGLFDIRAAKAELATAHLLGVDVPSCTLGDTDSLVERFVRGPELAASYRDSASWPIRAAAVWRAADGGESLDESVMIDLVVTVFTDLADSRPELTVLSLLPATEVLRLADADSAGVAMLDLQRPRALEPSEGPGCLLFRPVGAALSYVEMVHPADFRRIELDVSEESRRLVRLRHRLFSGHLEKGVILRARVRGAFCPRQRDTESAAAIYRAFASTE